VNAKLKTRFRIKGNAMINGICFSSVIKNTLPKDNIIKTYKNIQTGPKMEAGGDQEGFLS
jgi:hypothetical protein